MVPAINILLYNELVNNYIIFRMFEFYVFHRFHGMKKMTRWLWELTYVPFVQLIINTVYEKDQPDSSFRSMRCSCTYYSLRFKLKSPLFLRNVSSNKHYWQKVTCYFFVTKELFMFICNSKGTWEKLIILMV